LTEINVNLTKNGLQKTTCICSQFRKEPHKTVFDFLYKQLLGERGGKNCGWHMGFVNTIFTFIIEEE